MKQDKVFSEDYRPVEGEPFMNDRQLEYFRRKLVTWKNDLVSDSKETIEGFRITLEIFRILRIGPVKKPTERLN